MCACLQLVKNVFLTNERTWSRKLVEILLSLVIEKQMSKLDILHLYINKVSAATLAAAATLQPALHLWPPDVYGESLARRTRTPVGV